jgi:cobalamin biosynthesis protein CobT
MDATVTKEIEGLVDKLWEKKPPQMVLSAALCTSVLTKKCASDAAFAARIAGPAKTGTVETYAPIIEARLKALASAPAAAADSKKKKDDEKDKAASKKKEESSSESSSDSDSSSDGSSDDESGSGEDDEESDEEEEEEEEEESGSDASSSSSAASGKKDRRRGRDEDGAPLTPEYTAKMVKFANSKCALKIRAAAEGEAPEAYRKYVDSVFDHFGLDAADLSKAAQERYEMRREVQKLQAEGADLSLKKEGRRGRGDAGADDAAAKPAAPKSALFDD